MKLRTLYNDKRVLRWIRNTPRTSLRRYLAKTNPVWGFGVEVMSYYSAINRRIKRINDWLPRVGVQRPKGSRKFYWETNKKN